MDKNVRFFKTLIWSKNPSKIGALEKIIWGEYADNNLYT